tara:strand:+ start:459 stop:872 length:414 start_codon:yes stop_codon:yes gene_type:complete
MLGTVYKLHHKTNKQFKFYIGSTTNDKIRKIRHKYYCTGSKCKKYNYPLYRYIRANGGWDSWTMTPILTSGKYKEIEGLFIRRSWDKNINNDMPGRTHKEYREQNRARINKKIPCSKCGKLITRCNMAKHQKTLKCK